MVSSILLRFFFSLVGINCVQVQSSPLNAQRLLSENILSKENTEHIPGGSTFQLCSESDPDTDLFTIERIYWDPDPPRISRQQKLLVHGIFAAPIPWDAPGTGEVHVPEWHDPYSPASNFTDTGPFCTWMTYIYQTDDDRGLHKVCDGAAGENYVGPDAGPAVLVGEDMLFWPLPEGEYYIKIDAMMPDNEDGTPGRRIFCLEGTVDLDY